MVFLVTLGDNGQPPPDPSSEALQGLSLSSHDGDTKVPEPSQNRFAALFACFPVVASITSLLDLNDVDSLASSCRQVRENLLSFRTFVLLHTLHCDNDIAGARCARDLVRFCRRLTCDNAVCRNCNRLSTRRGHLSDEVLQNRLRRLCYFDQTIPIELTLSTFMPTWEMLCNCAEHIGGFCKTCSSEIQEALLAREFSRSYYEGVLYERLPGVENGTIETPHEDELRHDGVPCARGVACIAADLSTASKPLEPKERSRGDQGPFASDLTLYTGHQNIVGASILETDPLQRDEDIMNALYGGEYHVVRYGWTNDGWHLVDIDGMPFLAPEKAGKVRALCSYCHRIVPSEQDKKDWYPETRRG